MKNIFAQILSFSAIASMGLSSPSATAAEATYTGVWNGVGATINQTYPISQSIIETAIGTNFSSELDLTINSVSNPDMSNANQLWLFASGANGYAVSSNLTDNIELKSLTFTGSRRTFFVGNDAKTITILGDLKSTVKDGSMGTTIKGGQWIIGGNFSSTVDSCLGHTDYGAIKSASIAGNISGYVSMIHINRNSGVVYNAANWNTAELDLKGSISTSAGVTIYTDGASRYYKVGAINSNQTLSATNRKGTKETVLNLMITGAGADYANASATHSNSLTVSVGLFITHERSNIRLFMNSSDGALTQKFLNDNLNFSGGVDVMSGTLAISFKQINSQLKLTDYGAPSKVRTWTYWTDAAATTTQTSIAHGLLNMQGGKFTSASETATGAFRFSGISYSGGKIGLRLTSATNFDSLDITSCYEKIVESADAGGKTTITNIAGGTVTIESGKTMMFDFVGDLAWLIDSSLNDGKGVKIISWDSAASAQNKYGANIFSIADKTYSAEFTSFDDGLYVKYVAVPEPALVVSFFSLFVLLFAISRRRK